MADETRSNKVCTVTVVIAAVVFLLYSAAMTAFSQSTTLDYPTAVTGSQIAGKIRARDIGDSRLTSHYYIFETGTGDVLLNIETLNLNGDIDIYTAGSLKPLLKASVYANSYAIVMQRDVYLRLPSRLILRVEGRTPNDDPGEYKITFGGVFKAIPASSVPRNPGDPKVAGSSSEGAVARVSSTGAIIEEIKPPPPPVKEPVKAPVKGAVKPPVKETPKEDAKKAGSKETSAKNTPKESPKTTPAEKPKKPPVVVVTPLPDKKADIAREKAREKKEAEDRRAEEAAAKRAAKPKTEEKPKTPPPVKKNAATEKTDSASDKGASKPKSSEKTKPAERPRPVEVAPEQLEDVFLIVNMKEGESLRYSMATVQRVSVDKGIVTILLKNGGIARLSLLDIEEIKIGQ